jgi:hypothetical protein
MRYNGDMDDDDLPDPDLEAHPPFGNEDPPAGPNVAELAPAEPDKDADHVMRLIRHRCGDKIAEAVVPTSALEAVLIAIEALSDRIEEIESRTSAYGPARAYDADACGPLQ